MQADLRELVKQDKRSVPRRTDFLAQKGYIAKRTTVTRGFKTSRLWLKGFAPAELPAAGSSAPGSLTLDLSPDALRKDFEPVPWRHRWTGDNIEYTAFAQTFLAIIKAFGVMRLVNLKSKMGVLGLKWQMKVRFPLCATLAWRDHASPPLHDQESPRPPSGCCRGQIITPDWMIGALERVPKIRCIRRAEICRCHHGEVSRYLDAVECLLSLRSPF